MTVDPSSSSPPPRPVDRSERAVGFRPAKPCRWLAPSLLAPAAGRAWIGAFLGAFADRREVMAALPAQPAEDFSNQAGTGEFWFDYVADPGDGFDATYTVAWLLAAPALDVGEPEPLPRGRMLVMGGDQCYPTASIGGYQDRLVGPYRAALPFVPGGPDDQPRLYALPGNHDWYDGLTSFLRVFCQGANVGAWRTRQSRSYFAVRLPHRWWLLGIDVQFDSYVDQPQRHYFEQVASAMREGDAVIVCSAVPSWVAAGEGQPEAYAVLDFFERTVIRPTGAQVYVSLAGDRHHYARYAQVDGPGQKITSGGGGAYFVPTHRLPDSVVLPPEDSRAPNKTAPPARFVLQRRYPDSATSRRLGLGIARLPWLAPGLLAIIGALYLLIALAIGDAAKPPGGGLADRPDTIASNLRGAGLADLAEALVTSVFGIAVSVLTVVVCVLATRASRTRKGWLVGILHGVGQLALAVVVLFVVLTLVADLPGRWMLAVAGVGIWVVGGLAGTMLLAAYLLVAYDVARFASDDVYAAQGIAGYKNFLRMRIGSDGSLTIYPIGVPAVPRRWNLVRDGSPEDPWFSPADRQPEPFLIEAPIRVETPTRIDRSGP